MLRAVRLRAQLECRAAEDQADHHQDQRQVVGRQQRRIHDRKRAVQPCAAEHEKRLVAVPHRRDRIEHHLPLGFRVEERKQQTDAEIEAVEHHVEEHAEADDRGPHDRKIDLHALLRFGRIQRRRQGAIAQARMPVELDIPGLRGRPVLISFIM